MTSNDSLDLDLNTEIDDPSVNTLFKNPIDPRQQNNLKRFIYRKKIKGGKK